MAGTLIREADAGTIAELSCLKTPIWYVSSFQISVLILLFMSRRWSFRIVFRVLWE
jgi:hypothetical protein